MVLASVSVSSSFGWNSFGFLLQGFYQQKRSSVFHTLHIEGYSISIFSIKTFSSRCCLYCSGIDLSLQPLFWHFACLQHISNELLKIIAGALLMFPARGCVPNILPRECTGNTLPREVFLCTLPGAQWILYTYTAERRDVQPNSSRFEAVYGHSLIINPSLGMYQEIHPCRASSTYSVKINTSLPMMREWASSPPAEMGSE